VVACHWQAGQLGREVPDADRITSAAPGSQQQQQQVYAGGCGHSLPLTPPIYVPINSPISQP